MPRIFKNKTLDEAYIQIGNQTLIIPGGDEADLLLNFTLAQLQSCEALITYLGQGVDKYSLDDGTGELTFIQAIDLIRNIYPKEVALTGPKTTDEKQIVRISSYTLGTRLYMASRSDDRTNGRGKGPRMELSRSFDGTSDWLTCKFNDWIEMGGGELTFKGAVLGDWVTMKMKAPATVITPSPGTGNCNVHPTAGILVPAPLNDGAYTVDLTTADQCIPILSSGGLWKWTYPNEGCGTFSIADGDGNCHLVPAAIEIHTYVQELGLLGDGHLTFTYPGIDPTRIPPQWEFATRLHNEGGNHTVEVAWTMICARMNGQVSHS